MRPATVLCMLSALASTAGCFPAPLDETGKSCSAARPCSAAWACVQSVCVRKGSPGDGGTPDAPVTKGAAWRYDDHGTDLGSAWRTTSFDDGAWSQGAAPLGYGTSDAVTTVCCTVAPLHLTNYFRHTFTLTAPLAAAYTLALRRDDGAVVYVNGTEVLRSNMPSGAISASTPASVHNTGADETTYFEANVDAALLRVGTNTVAVEVHQDRLESTDAIFDLELRAK